MSDESLLALFGSSDPIGAPAFVERFQRRVFGLALTIVGDRRSAEDVAQEALLRAWRHADAFDPRQGSVATWILTIARNLSIDALRRHRPLAIAPDDQALSRLRASERDPADEAAVADDVGRLRFAITRLPDAQQRAILLAGVWGLSAREIAQREDIPLGTAKTRIRIALERLRVALVRHET